HPWLLSGVLNICGQGCLARQELAQAEVVFAEALAVAQRVEAQEYAANALFGGAQVAAAQGRSEAARKQGRPRLEIYQRWGRGKTGEVARWLGELGAGNEVAPAVDADLLESRL